MEQIGELDQLRSGFDQQDQKNTRSMNNDISQFTSLPPLGKYEYDQRVLLKSLIKTRIQVNLCRNSLEKHRAQPADGRVYQKSPGDRHLLFFNKKC